MLDYPALAALNEVIRRGTFEAAAAALGVTPSAISQRIRTLEDRMGTVLIDRGPPLAATEAGMQLSAHLDKVRLLEAGLNQNAAPPVLRLAINADSLATWVMPALTAASGLVDLVIDDQDHALDWLRSGQVVASITSDSRAVAGCDCIALGSMRYRATATPDFVARHLPDGIGGDALSRAPSLNFNAKDALQSRWAEIVSVQKQALTFHRIPSSHAFAQATRLGLGWGLNPEIVVQQDLDQGRLVDLAPEQPLDVPLYWQSSRVAATMLSPLTKAIRKAAKAALLPGRPQS